MSVEPCSGVSSAGPSGVWEAARDHGLVRNRRDPSAWPSSGKDHRYKPMVKSCGGQRESDGVVVPVIGVQHNAPGGKGADFGRAGGGGKREGMTGTARSNNPGGQPRPVELHRFPPVGQVRELQRKLWAAAKQSEGRRFHALFDRSCRVDVRAEAWKRVRANRGAAGVDRVTLAEVEEYGVDRMLRELRRDLLAGDIVRRRCGGWTSPNRTAGCGRSVFPLCAIVWRNRRRSWSWNRSSRPTSCRAVSGSARGAAPPMPWR